MLWLLPAAEWELEIAAIETLVSEGVQNVVEDVSELIVVSPLPKGGLAHAGYLLMRMRAQRRDVKIVVGRRELSVNLQRNRNRYRIRVPTGWQHLLDVRNLLDEWRTALAFRAAHESTADKGGEPGVRKTRPAPCAMSKQARSALHPLSASWRTLATLQIEKA